MAKFENVYYKKKPWIKSFKELVPITLKNFYLLSTHIMNKINK